MQLLPEFDDFEVAHKAGRHQIVWARLVADLDTPVSLMLKLAQAREHSFMLESVTGGEVRGRYSVIGMRPDVIWRCRGTEAEINRAARYDADGFVAEPDDPLTSLRRLIAESRIEMPEGLPPIAAGLYGYLGYDMIRLVEHLPNVNPDPLGLPDGMFMRPTIVVVVDGVKGEVTVVSPAWAGDGQSAVAHDPGDGADLGEAVSNTSPKDYRQMVDRAKDYIRAGDIFQVVPSQRWSVPYPLPPFALYRALRRTNPSPYMFFFNMGGFQIVGASPEILVQVQGTQVTIRPIAGTRPRGRTTAEDLALEADLLADPKERAEHLMLLDLGRNDVGRVSKINTVDPNEQFIIERYSHVMHIVSNVRGELSDDEDALSALLAGLPAGTVSGAPKVRAMEIIDELESEKRGVYGGGVGYFAANGDMDICIALRTGVVKDQTLFVQAGGGVVFDSDPDAEFEETVNKAKALRQAAKDAGLFVGDRDGN